MAKYQDDPVQLRELYLSVLGWSWTIGLSTGVGTSPVAPDVVPLVLGPKWLSITPLLGWIALDAGLAALGMAAYTLLDVRGLPHLGARIQWLRVVIIGLAVFPVAYVSGDLLAIFMVRLAVTRLLIPAVLVVAGRSIKIGMRDHLGALWRASVAAAVMAGAVFSLNQGFAISGPVRLAWT